MRPIHFAILILCGFQTGCSTIQNTWRASQLLSEAMQQDALKVRVEFQGPRLAGRDANKSIANSEAQTEAERHTKLTLASRSSDQPHDVSIEPNGQRSEIQQVGFGPLLKAPGAEEEKSSASVSPVNQTPDGGQAADSAGNESSNTSKSTDAPSGTGKPSSGVAKTDKVPRRARRTTLPTTLRPTPLIESELLQDSEPDQGSWTLEELQDVAMRNSPALQVNEAGQSILDGKFWQASLGPNPTLQYNADEVGDDGSAGLHTVSVSQKFLRGGKLVRSMQVVNRQIVQNAAAFELRKAQLANRVRARFNDVLIAQKRIQLMTELLENADESVKVNERQLEAKQISRNPVLQARILKNTSELLLKNARNDRRAAWQKLAVAVGNPNLKERRVAGSIDGLAAELGVWERVLTELLANSPRLAQARTAIEVARAEAQRAHAFRAQDITAGIGAGYATSSNHVFSSLSLSMPLPIVNWNQGNIHAAEARVVQARRQVDQLELDLQDRLVTTAVGRLSAADTEAALDAGAALAKTLIQCGVIQAAALSLNNEHRLTGDYMKELHHA